MPRVSLECDGYGLVTDYDWVGVTGYRSTTATLPNITGYTTQWQWRYVYVRYWNGSSWQFYKDRNAGDNDDGSMNNTSTYNPGVSITIETWSNEWWYYYMKPVNKNPITYTITYNANRSGVGDIFADNVNFDSTITLRNYPVTQAEIDGWYGYYVSNWYIRELNTHRNSGSSYTHKTAQNIWLFAGWSARTFKVEFHYNDSRGGYWTEWSSIAFDSTNTLPGSIGSANGYYYHSGWQNDRMGAKGLSASVTFNFYAYNMIIYATYTPNNYTLLYNLDQGTSTGGGQAAGTVTYNRSYSMPNKPTRTGYTFHRWVYNGTNYLENATFTWATGDATITATWNINNWNVIYDGNIIKTNDRTTLLKVTKSGNWNTIINHATVKAIGYTFSNWNSLANGTGTNPVSATNYTIPDNATTWFAIWKNNKVDQSGDTTARGIKVSDFQAVFGGSATSISLGSYRSNVGLGATATISINNCVGIGTGS